MNDVEVERWCKKHSWTEPRELEVGSWVAFSPGGAIETPLPLQAQTPKSRPLEHVFDFVLLILVTIIMLAIAIIMSPCFIEPLISRRRQDC